MTSIPRWQAPLIISGGQPSQEWYRYWKGLELAASGDGWQAKLSALDGRVLELERRDPTSARIMQGEGITVSGQLSGGIVNIALSELPDAGGGALKKIDRDGFGRVAGTSDAFLGDLADVGASAPVVKDVLQWTGAQWEPKQVEAGVLNLDGGRANSTYGGTTAINGGAA